MTHWFSRFIRAMVIGGDASELAELQRARRERDERRTKEISFLRRLFSRGHR